MCLTAAGKYDFICIEHIQYLNQFGHHASPIYCPISPYNSNNKYKYIGLVKEGTLYCHIYYHKYKQMKWFYKNTLFRKESVVIIG